MSDADAIASYVEWLKENGATFDAIEWPYETPITGRGAILTKDLKAGEPFLSVPSKLIINAPFCRSEPEIGPFLAAHELFLQSEELTLAMYLLHEKFRGKDSFWFPYIRMLPEDTGNLGRSWTTEELAELQDEQFVQEICVMIPNERKEQFQAIMRVFKHSASPIGAIFSANNFDLNSFSWAMEIVLSRVFGRRIQYVSLVPLADNLNHGNVGVKYAISKEDGRFRLFPTVDLHGRIEAFNSYGRRSNANLLMGYGFAIPNNEWDDVQLDLELPPMASPEKRKLFDWPGPFIAQFRFGAIPEQYLRFFRLIYASKQDVARMTSFSKGGFSFVNAMNERAVLRTCKSEVEGLFSLFATSMEEDLELLQSDRARANTRFAFALHYRLGRKRALHFSLMYFTRIEAWLLEQQQNGAAVSEEEYKRASSATLGKLVEEEK